MKNNDKIVIIISTIFIIAVSSLSIGYARYDKILTLNSSVTIEKLGSIILESVKQISTNRPNSTGNGMILLDGSLALNYSFSVKNNQQSSYTDKYLVTIFNDSHQDYIFSGFNISPEINLIGISSNNGTATVTYEFDNTIEGSDLSLNDNIIKPGEKRKIGIKLLIEIGSKSTGTIEIGGGAEVYTSEDNSGQFYGYIDENTTSVDLKNNSIDCFSINVLNTYKTTKSFTAYPGNHNFEFVDVNGSSLENLTIASPNDDNPEENIQNYTICIKAKSTALFQNDYASSSVILSSNSMSPYSIGYLNINVNKTDEKDEEKVHIDDVQFEPIRFDSSTNKLLVKASWKHLQDQTDKHTSVLNYYILLFDSNVSSTNPIYTFIVDGDATIDNYTFSLDQSNYLNEQNMVTNNHNYFIKVYGVDEAGNSGLSDCTNNDNDFCVASQSTSLKYKFNMKINSTNSRVKFSDGTTTTNVYLNEAYQGELKVTANDYNISSTATLKMGDETLKSGITSDYTYGLKQGENKITNLNIFENKIKDDITIEASSYYNNCLVEGTKIRLANGSVKKIEDINYDDLILAVSHDTGKVIEEYPIWIEKKGIASYYQLTTFSDGSKLKTVGSHGVFSADKNKYVSVLNRDDFHIGTRVIKINDKNEKEIVTVKNIKKINEDINYYHVSSTYYHNIIAENILTTDAILIVSNMFPFNNDLTWTKEREEFLKKGDLFVYEDWAFLFPEHIFKGFRMSEGMILKYKGILDISKFDEVLNGRMKEPFKSKNGKYKWPVTTSDNINDLTDKLYEEHSFYELPNPKKVKNKTFIGWLNNADNKIYNPRDKIEVIYGMHFKAIWE